MWCKCREASLVDQQVEVIWVQTLFWPWVPFLYVSAHLSPLRKQQLCACWQMSLSLLLKKKGRKAESLTICFAPPGYSIISPSLNYFSAILPSPDGYWGVAGGLSAAWTKVMWTPWVSGQVIAFLYFPVFGWRFEEKSEFFSQSLCGKGTDVSEVIYRLSGEAWWCESHQLFFISFVPFH